ncbi:MAG TPA: hypothetical protein VH593_10160 [Ktedonobacteraceae bacterium]|jgi:hypothetical protein
MRLPPGDRIIINTDYVHSVGAQVKADVQTLLGPGQHSVQDFHDTLTQVNNTNFPYQLTATFSQFIEAHTNELTMLYNGRLHIGDGLRDAADEAEQTEIKNMAMFNTEPNSTIGGPQTLPILKL